ncbi:MAG: TonB-dependent receptor [Gammaproteobacteria bacterium]|jgi:outer membrane receptor protein involved in Fe transport|nr:TonB-dependent receptor [Chromatiales bacterium]MDP7153168.1 TonB-dependent receptor [Gammaproteobacteria bacterium]MDP7295826.1 TonB-dependent receptor [Gammaproteobacteria bacterium]MDP7419421.1 TonB-dependent receptor [Gammaproteobacteria bacterium]MDP7659706.1 TonB-dependent receptor [Gammaproteobacteria bacterium]
MKDNYKLREAVKHTLGLSVGMIAATTAPAVLAQDQDQEEMIVTGSRIKRADLSSSSPVSVINREEMLATGITDVGQLLQSMPSMSGSPIGTTTNNGGNGGVFVDLRGMGTARTLTLIDGKRMVDGGDYQTIPASMIERIEILKDGASAVYGADAVAGVVNIITRRDFEGVEVNAQTADFFDMDQGRQNSISLIAGTTFAGGNFVFGAEYVDQEEAYQRDAPWDFFQDSYYIYPEGCEAQTTAPYTGAPSGGCYPIGSSRIPESRLGFMNQGTFLIDGADAATSPYEVGTMSSHDGRTYNYAPVNYIQTPYERTNVFAEAHFDLSENIRFNTAIRTNFRNSAQELAPMPYNSPTDPAYSDTFGSTAYNGISEDNYYLRRAVDAYNVANGAALVYEPVSDARRRMIETTRRFTQDVTQFQIVMGLEGKIQDIDWEIYYNRGHRDRTDIDVGQFAGDRLSNAMGPSADLDSDGQPECYRDIADPNTLIANCVPINFFGGAGTLTQDMIDYVAVALTDNHKERQDIVGLSFSGSIPIWGGEELGWAAGYGYWGQTYRYDPDSGKQLGAVTGNTGASTKGSLYSNSLYTEVLVPVFDNGTQSLDLNGGLRRDKYNTFGSDTTWQFGFELQAIESLKLRGTAGEVFRAPTIGDLFAGQQDSFPTYVDPCAQTPLPAGCDQASVQLDSQVLALVGGNPNLQPETGDTWTVGLVWTPELFGGNQSLTVDYWDIDIEDGVSSLGVQYILDDCYDNLNQASCDLVTRRADYSIAQIIDGSLNVAEQGAQGIDVEFRTGFDSSVGQWEAAILWAHLLERTKTASPGEDEEDLSGRYTDPTAEDGGAYAEDKVSYSLQWASNGWTIAYLGEYISGLDADTFCNCGAGNQPDGSYIQDVESFLYHDLVASYATDFTGAGTTTITAGITNISDEDPPFIEVGFNATTDPATYRMFGTGYYLRLTHAFK